MEVTVAIGSDLVPDPQHSFFVFPLFSSFPKSFFFFIFAERSSVQCYWSVVLQYYCGVVLSGIPSSWGYCAIKCLLC